MKNTFFLGIAVLGSTVAVAQNTAVVNQQNGAHEVSVVPQGSSNTSVVNQSNTGTNQAVITQSGAGNVATITQGNRTDSLQNTVSTSQSGGGETIVNQTNGGNSISIHQSGPAATDQKKKPGKKRSKE